jgi:hypothetical protein
MANQTDITKKDSKDKTEINKLPEYKIQTMKDDLTKAGPSKPEFIPAPPDKLPVVERVSLPSTEELISKRELPKPPKPAPKIEKPKVPILEKKPRKEKKPFWTPKKKRGLIIIIIIIIILIAIGGFFYWQGTKPESFPEPEPQPQAQTPEPSTSLIPVDETKIISLSIETSVFNLLKQEAETDQLINTFKRIAILKTETEFLSLNELFQELEIIVPPYALTELGPDYTLVLYNQDEGKRLGLITQVKNSENLKTQLTNWEQTMLNNFQNFYIDDQPGQKETETFQDDIYSPDGEAGQKTAIRYINLPTPDLTINYAIVNDLLIISTSKELIYTIIDKILK